MSVPLDRERDPATIWTPPEAAGTTPGRGRLAGRRILIVGAGAQPCDDADAPLGNGRAISILCAREGASVACADRDESAARETARQIAAERGRSAVLVALLRRFQGRSRRPVPACGIRRRPPRHPREPRRAGLDRHAARACREPRPPVARENCDTARAAGHGLGGCLRNGVSAGGGVELCDRAAAGSRWGAVCIEMKSQAKA